MGMEGIDFVPFTTSLYFMMQVICKTKKGRSDQFCQLYARTVHRKIEKKKKIALRNDCYSLLKFNYFPQRLVGNFSR